ncbi:assimilatory sulfite reductase (NADPH) flavoprotein subunit [Thiomicrorhabdus sp.]|uniref:assimilatory sulfite reductase (NADPH) flavoprotein subunit n=1 Tax=Thiomicrorhabdus sp. TaxID=2039724 RepID=UPI0029C63531|nr:assimilatory sulfite reductase (NADPH) flavoprotein subunit [Thiomicrorhabdus sp.]
MSNYTDPALLLFEPHERDGIEKLVNGASPFKLAWLSGYLAARGWDGFKQENLPSMAAEKSSVSDIQPVRILFASQTGNAQSLAEQLHNSLCQAGLAAELTNISDFKLSQLKEESRLVLITSTQGEGEPPESAESFFKLLSGKRAPDLKHLSFAVLGLGDRSYEFFCQAAIDADRHFSDLGGKAFLPVQALDVDYEQEANAWSEQLVSVLKAQQPEESSFAIASDQNVPASAEYGKQTPFKAQLLVNQAITSLGSAKGIRHYEISLETSGIQYQPGDVLGVYFRNNAASVDELLKTLSLKGTETVQLDGEAIELRHALLEKFELTQSYPKFAKAYAEHSNQTQRTSPLRENVADAVALRAYLAERQIYDIVAEFPCQLEAQDLADMLRKQQPRFYSIASAQSEVGEEVHLTVRTVEYDAFGSTHYGGASGCLASLKEGDDIRVFVQPSEFKLPKDPQTPVIMVGPGTGIAPFRSFLQHREQAGAQGENWLFFGNSRFCEDFLYQQEWQEWLRSGLLTRMNTAFSRDQATRIYVQHRLKEEGKTLFEWLQRGAFIYVCGDASRMAKDVHQALIDVIAEHGNRSSEQAEAYLDQLKQEKRYQKDVY